MFKKININYLLIFLYYSFIIVNFHLSLPVFYTLPLFSFFLLLNIKYFFSFKFSKNLYIFIIIFLYSLLSIFYSMDKIEAIKRNVSLGLMIVFLWLVYKQLSMNYILKFIKHASLLGVVYIMLNLIFFNHFLDYKEEFIGFVKNRHNISIILGFYFIMIYVYSRLVSSSIVKLILYFSLIIDLYLIIMSYGRIGLYVIFVYLLSNYLIYFKKLNIFFKLILIFLFVFVSIILINFLLDNSYIEYIINRGMTGRDLLSSTIINYFYNYKYHLLIGFGAGSLKVISHIVNNILNHHFAIRDINNFVSILIIYGYTGFILFLYIFVKYFLMITFFIKKNTKYIMLFLIPLPFILDISESNWINFNNFLTIVMYVFIVFTYKSYVYRRFIL